MKANIPALVTRPFKKLLRPLFPITGEPHLWRAVRAEQARTGSRREGIQALRSRFELSELPAANRPVFVLSPTWRCGSTLLQRLLMSSGEIWMWGEVYARLSQIQRLSSVFTVSHSKYPFPDMYPDSIRDVAPEDAWIANLSPDPEHLLRAHRTFWDSLLGHPAEAKGYARWGFKEVHLSVDHAWYLRALYPDARIIFLLRNPYAAWLSYARYRTWYAHYPDQPIVTAQAFGRLWHRHTAGFLRDASQIDAFLLRHEDLVSDNDVVRQLEEYVCCTVQRSVLEKRIREGKTVSNVGKRQRTGWLERKALQRAVEPIAGSLGYEPE